MAVDRVAVDVCALATIARHSPPFGKRMGERGEGGPVCEAEGGETGSGRGNSWCFLRKKRGGSFFDYASAEILGLAYPASMPDTFNVQKVGKATLPPP